MAQLLDAHPGPGVPSLGTAWERDVEQSLTRRPADWRAALDGREIGVDRSGVLLGWAEDAATRVVRQRSPELLRRAIEVLTLLADGPLDRRDVMVVGILLHRGAVLAGLPWAPGVRLSGLGSGLPPTHLEEGAGLTFGFRRVTGGSARKALLRRIGGDLRAVESRLAAPARARAELMRRLDADLRALQQQRRPGPGQPG